MKATASSSTLRNNNIRTGNILIIVSKPPNVNIFQANPDIIANRICPLVIFAANRTPSDIARAM